MRSQRGLINMEQTYEKLENHDKALGKFLVITSLAVILSFVFILQFSSAGTLINESGFYNTNSAKLTTNGIVVGLDNNTEYQVDSSNSTSAYTQIQEAIYKTNQSSTGGMVTIKPGYYNIINGASTFITLARSFNKGVWIRGEGFSTVLAKNNTNSGLFALENSPSTPANGIIISDLQITSDPLHIGRLLNGNPAGSVHKNIFLERILATEMGGNSSRFINLDATNVHINGITLFGQLKGGEGSHLFVSQNLVTGNESLIASEVECMDANNNNDANESFIYANSMSDCYEQVMDIGNRWSHVFGNHLEVNTPTDQGGLTIVGDYSPLIGNTIEDAQNSRGGIEYHEGANFGAIIGNIITTNQTNITDGSIQSNKLNPTAVGMRIDGENGTFIGNVFVGVNGTQIFQGATSQDNQFIGNWFEPRASLTEPHWGINLLGDPANSFIKRWVVQGANLFVTRNLTVNQTISSQRINVALNTSAITCNAGTEGNLYYDGSTKRHYGCNSTTWNALY